MQSFLNSTAIRALLIIISCLFIFLTTFTLWFSFISFYNIHLFARKQLLSPEWSIAKGVIIAQKNYSINFNFTPRQFCLRTDIVANNWRLLYHLYSASNRIFLFTSNILHIIMIIIIVNILLYIISLYYIICCSLHFLPYCFSAIY